MATFSDTFTGSGPLGTTEVGGAQWVLFKFWSSNVSWSRSGGRAVTSDLTTPSIMAINAGTGDVDVSVNVHPSGGDCLYFRVKNFENWWRLSVVEGVKYGDENFETGVGTAEYLWQQQYRHPDPASGAYPLIVNEYMWSSSNGSPPAFPSSIWYTHAHDSNGDGVDDENHSGYYYLYGSASVVDGKMNSLVDNTWSVYYVRLEKCVDGNIEEVEFWVQGANNLRVVTQRSLISVYINDTFKGTFTDATHEKATFHGFGYNWYSGAQDSAIDNFICDTFYTDPTAPTIVAPKGSAVINRDISQQFSWLFNDPDPGDMQAKYELRYRLSGAGTWQATITAGLPYWYHIFPPGTFTEGATYEWQVRTTDNTGRVGPWSTSAFFVAEEMPAGPTITSPTNGGNIGEDTVVQWSAAAQDAHQVRVLVTSTGAVYFDTGEVTSASDRSYSLDFTETGVQYTIQVRVKVDGLWSEYGEVTVTTAFTPPVTPYMNLIASRETGAILIEITNREGTLGEPATTHNEIWIDDGNGYERKVAVYPPNTNWMYWTPVSGRDYISAVRVVAVGANGATAAANPPKFLEVSYATDTDLAQTLIAFKGKGAIIGLVTETDSARRLPGVYVNKIVETGEAVSMGVSKGTSVKTVPVNQVTQANTSLAMTACRIDPFWGNFPDDCY